VSEISEISVYLANVALISLQLWYNHANTTWAVTTGTRNWLYAQLHYFLNFSQLLVSCLPLLSKLI